MWTDAESEIQQQLDAEEHLLWCGKPRDGIRFRLNDVFLIPFSLVWCGFAIFWEIMALTAIAKAHGPAGAVFPLFGIPFVLLGLYFVFGRFLVEAKSRERMTYAVTDQRVIIIKSFFGRTIKSLSLKTLSDVSLTEHSDGSGIITFGPNSPWVPWFAQSSWPGTQQLSPPSFDLIEHAKEVYDLVRQAQKNAT